jgi:hypothetical protein
MKKEIIVKMKKYISFFDEWASSIYLNADKDFVQDNHAENKLYRIISNAFQDQKAVNLVKLRATDVYGEFERNINQWGSLYQQRFFQSSKGIEILTNISDLAGQLLNDFQTEPEIMGYFGKTIAELVDVRDNALEARTAINSQQLENALLLTFNSIEKAYVELAYAKINNQIKAKNIDQAEFWEEPIMEYIMETWWPKRRVYKNQILIIDIENYPNELKFEWKQFMGSEFYECGIFNFLKQLRNQLTHVKTSTYHDNLMKELFTDDFMNYWCQMNASITMYIIAYLMISEQKSEI